MVHSLNAKEIMGSKKVGPDSSFAIFKFQTLKMEERIVHRLQNRPGGLHLY